MRGTMKRSGDVAGALPRTPDKSKGPKEVSDFRSVGKKNPPAINRGTFTPCSLSTLWVAPASPFATVKIIDFATPVVKRLFGVFAFIPAVSVANGRVLYRAEGALRRT